MNDENRHTKHSHPDVDDVVDGPVQVGDLGIGRARCQLRHRVGRERHGGLGRIDIAAAAVGPLDGLLLLLLDGVDHVADDPRELQDLELALRNGLGRADDAKHAVLQRLPQLDLASLGADPDEQDSLCV